MSATITVILTLSEVFDPPVVTALVRVDDRDIATQDLTPAEAVAALGVIAPDSAKEAMAVFAPALALVQRLETNVRESAAKQAAREKTLGEWQEALGKLPVTPPPAEVTPQPEEPPEEPVEGP